jgi:hypothetical protein
MGSRIGRVGQPLRVNRASRLAHGLRARWRSWLALALLAESPFGLQVIV